MWHQYPKWTPVCAPAVLLIQHLMFLGKQGKMAQVLGTRTHMWDPDKRLKRNDDIYNTFFFKYIVLFLKIYNTFKRKQEKNIWELDLGKYSLPITLKVWSIKEMGRLEVIKILKLFLRSTTKRMKKWATHGEKKNIKSYPRINLYNM